MAARSLHFNRERKRVASQLRCSYPCQHLISFVHRFQVLWGVVSHYYRQPVVTTCCTTMTSSAAAPQENLFEILYFSSTRSRAKDFASSPLCQPCSIPNYNYRKKKMFCSYFERLGHTEYGVRAPWGCWIASTRRTARSCSLGAEARE